MTVRIASSLKRHVLVGIDFDNTIVRYDGLFHALAVEQGLIPQSVPPAKEQIRDHLRGLDREDDWTRLQGFAYGPGMARAKPFQGVLEFLTRCHQAGVLVTVISHRTLHPYLGPRYDLHASARAWLSTHGVLDSRGIGLAQDLVHFETTKEAKLARIAQCGCSHFIDDLPEFLSDPCFPDGVGRILFDPHHTEIALHPEIRRVGSWGAVTEMLMAAAAR